MFPIPLPVESSSTHALLDPTAFVRKRNHLVYNNFDHMFSWRLSMINSAPWGIWSWSPLRHVVTAKIFRSLRRNVPYSPSHDVGLTEPATSGPQPHMSRFFFLPLPEIFSSGAS
ncbi:hypothetical protein HZ326_24748 [Fusarium oxysporum f. sp. albedinis]|nr:hypothetical protein HZ326_24748 [Fusarium oxysporum f. sp. albedinis]